MKVAIVGSRDYPRHRWSLIWGFVKSLPDDTEVVSGGARGVDTLAAQAASNRWLKVTEFLPDYATHGRRAPLVRNQQIVDYCDQLVAFWDGTSRGTQHVVRLARKAGKPVITFGGEP